MAEISCRALDRDAKRADAKSKDALMSSQRLWFAKFAQWVSHVTGRPITFLSAIAIILIWALVGPLVGYTDTWQLVINTATTIITFLMVFVIQNTQNRDTAAMHIKIDELIRVTRKARNVLLDLEELDDKTLEQLRTDYEQLARDAKSRTRGAFARAASPA
jgi:low affinity Fe/Cu permease